jgi:luciferase-type oxidoreductase
MFPIEATGGAVPTMIGQERLARRAEELGFAALWFRDVPLSGPAMGDVGQVFDTFVYLAHIAAHTEGIALATGSVVFPLRHPIDLAKASSSVDVLSGGRLLLGVATGDRPVEYPAYGVDFGSRGERFRETFAYFRRISEENFPEVDSPLGRMRGADLLPKPVGGRVPMLVTGSSGQSSEWIAANADGWLSYPHHAGMVAEWRRLVGRHDPGRFKPFAQPFAIDLAERPDDSPTRGGGLEVRLGREPLAEYLEHLRALGVNHVVLDLRFGARPAGEVLEELGADVVPRFPARDGPGPARAETPAKNPD